MEEEILLTDLRKRLSLLNISYENLDKQTQNGLLKIENEIRTRMQAQQYALAALRSNKINVNAIARPGIISNKTIYKYPVLLEYIKLCEELYEKSIPQSNDEIADLKERLRLANSTIKKMDEHVVSVEIKEQEADELRRSLKDMETKLGKILEENVQLQKELNRIKAAHPECFKTTKSKILVMNRNTQS